MDGDGLTSSPAAGSDRPPPDGPPQLGIAPQDPLLGVEEEARIGPKVRRAIFGRPRDPYARGLFHRISLVAFLAWVGFGADGMSSAAYGPAEAFLALGRHRYLALGMVVLVPLTVIIISAAYTRIIEAFPQGGGGYAVTTKLLGPRTGVVAGSALLVDYVLTITVSIAAAGDAIFSMLPQSWQGTKVPIEVGLLLLGIAVNIRGTKESVLPLVPVFLLFIVTHVLLILAGVFMNIGQFGETASELGQDFQRGLRSPNLGLWGMFVLLIRAYSLGAGTYTGIEAVSNGLNVMREPRVQTAKRTMTYMSISLAITAAGLILSFLFMRVSHQDGKTLNAVLAESVVQGWDWGWIFVMATMVSEAAILIVAAQTGFLGGPRVLSNMALDGWVPRRFASLSDRLTTQNGIALMGLAALAALLLTQGHVHTLVVMYSINVFITFTLSMAAMARSSLGRPPEGQKRSRGNIVLFLTGLVLCLIILIGTSVVKFGEGGWITLSVTGTLVVLCFLIRKHYRGVSKRLVQLQHDLRVPERAHAPTPPPFDAAKPTAAVLVGGYSGLGIHTMLGALTSFGGHFKNVVFVSVGVIDTGVFKGEAEIDALRAKTEEDLKKYVELAHRLGVPAQYRFNIGIDLVDELEDLCLQVQKDIGRVSFFAGQLTFRTERWFDRFLHNQTAFTLQRRLHWAGIPILILPIRVR